MNQKIKTYSELQTYSTYLDRLEFLRIHGNVGAETFGFDRIFNQQFYRSNEWKRVRNSIILRDCGFDMGLEGIEIVGPIYVHHMNPIDLSDIKDATEFLTNPEYLISVSQETHNAIHYGTLSELDKMPSERTLNDTCPWRNK